MREPGAAQVRASAASAACRRHALEPLRRGTARRAASSKSIELSPNAPRKVAAPYPASSNTAGGSSPNRRMTSRTCSIYEPTGG